jgi:hypothetical protein
MAKDVVVRLITDAKGWVKGHKDAEAATEGLSKRQKEAAKLSGGLADKMTELREEFAGKFGPASKNVDDALSKVTGSLAAMPVASQAALGGVTALGAGMAVMVAQGVQKLGALTDSVRQYRDAANLSWESASRINAVFAEMGIEAEDGIDVIKTMTEEISLAPDKFERYGIAIARAADGTVDANATFANLSDRFTEIQDPARRAAMGSEIFGDTWLKIAPVLAKGGDEIRRISDAVEDHQIVTEESAEQQRELQEALRDLGNEWDGLQMTLAKSALPEIVRTMRDAADTVDLVTDAYYALSNAASKIPGTGLAKEYAESITPGLKFRDLLQDIRRWRQEDAEAAKNQTVATDRMTQSTDYSAKAQAEHAEELALTKARLDDATSASNRHAGAMDASRRSAELLRSEQKKLEDSVKSLYDATLSSIDTEFRWQRQQETTADSIRELAWRQSEASEAKRQYGADSEFAQNAEEAYRRTVADTTGSVIDAARATADNARVQAEANGVTLTAQQYNAIYKDELIRLRDTAGDQALATALDRYITKLNETETAARNAAAQVAELSRQAAISAGATQGQGMGIITSAAAAERLAGQRATGGPVAAGKSYLVGEQGPEILTMGSQPGRVTANGELGGGLVLNVTLNGVMAESVDRLVAQITPALHESMRQLQAARR